MKKKKIYEQPETAVTRVELESSICSGSVNFDTPKRVEINEQDFANMNGTNDFSDKPFEVPNQDTF